jgi:hypothetical protein
MSCATLTLDQDIRRPKYNPWLIAVVVAVAAFMEVLDGLIQHWTNSGLSPAVVQKRTYARIYQLVQAQAPSLAYVDTFMVLAIGSAIVFSFASF